MYDVNAQGVDERKINVHYYYEKKKFKRQQNKRKTLLLLLPDTVGSEESRKRSKTTSDPLFHPSRNTGDDDPDRAVVAAPASSSPPPPHTETGVTGNNTPLQPVPLLHHPHPHHRASVARQPAALKDTPQAGNLSAALLRSAPSAKFLRPHVFGGVMGAASVGGDGHALALGPHHFATSFPASLPSFCAPRFLGPMCPLQLESFRHAFGAVPPT